MRRNERERIERRNAFQAARKLGYWTPTGFSLDGYLAAVQSHPPIPEMLEYLSTNHRVWTDQDSDFNESKNGSCEKCSARALNLGPMAELKSSGHTGFDGLDVQYSKFIAERFFIEKEPITLTPELHREFICQSWIEAAHLHHIKEHIDKPGIAAIEAQPELENGAVGITLSFRAIDGSHRAALTHREGRPFSVRVLSPLENLKSIFAIGFKKNPFFALRYSPELDKLLALMTSGKVGPNVQT
jgi:hypothetical protein